MASGSSLPEKTRELHSHHFDSTIWNDFPFRDDDIIISTYAKSGTTWMQQIIAQMMMGGDPDLEVAEMSPWMDLRVPPKEVKLPGGSADTSSLPENAPARRCARLLTQSKVSLHRARRKRRRLEPV
jgi:aryl sulfotransferase